MPFEYLFHRTQAFPKSLEEVFDFFARPENLQTITPPWLDFKITQAPSALGLGSMIHYRLRIHRVPVRWITEITEWDPPLRFVDTQVSGPYALWRHEHIFEVKEGLRVMHDRVHYALPFGILGRFVHWGQVRRDVEKIFDYRAKMMKELLGG